MNISSNRLCHQTEHTYIIVHWVALISHVREARREIFTTPGLVTARRSILGPPAEGRPGPSFPKKRFCRRFLVTSFFWTSLPTHPIYFLAGLDHSKKKNKSFFCDKFFGHPFPFMMKKVSSLSRKKERKNAEFF